MYDMDEEVNDKLQQLLALYRKLPGSDKDQELDVLLKDFLEHGPGTREERLEVLDLQFKKLEREYNAFLKGRH